MSDKTYIELCKNEKATVQINVWRNDGTPLTPSAAYYEVKGSEKDTLIVSRSPAQVNRNHVYTQLGLSVTASAAEYDLYWEIHKSGGDLTNHCTKVLVIETC